MSGFKSQTDGRQRQESWTCLRSAWNADRRCLFGLAAVSVHTGTQAWMKRHTKGGKRVGLPSPIPLTHVDFLGPDIKKKSLSRLLLLHNTNGRVRCSGVGLTSETVSQENSLKDEEQSFQDVHSVQAHISLEDIIEKNKQHDRTIITFTLSMLMKSFICFSNRKWNRNGKNTELQQHHTCERLVYPKIFYSHIVQLRNTL